MPTQANLCASGVSWDAHSEKKCNEYYPLLSAIFGTSQKVWVRISVMPGQKNFQRRKIKYFPLGNFCYFLSVVLKLPARETRIEPSVELFVPWFNEDSHGFCPGKGLE
ncbi:MAG TPA: hypothetical protein V6C72_17110 [Chroococcales cyanobacterium]